MSQFDPVYELAAGTVLKATSSATLLSSIPVGIAIATATSGNAVSILTRGLITNSGWNFTSLGLAVYVATNGTLTQTCPSTSTYWTCRVGYARTATCLKVDIGPMVKVQ